MVIHLYVTSEQRYDDEEGWKVRLYYEAKAEDANEESYCGRGNTPEEALKDLHDNLYDVRHSNVLRR